jgi:hypothetical protein
MFINNQTGQVGGLSTPTGSGQAARHDEMATSLQQGRHTLWLQGGGPAALTSAAAPGLFQTVTHKNLLSTWDFDAGTQERAQIWIGLPKGAGKLTVSARFAWLASSSNGTAVFGLRGRVFADGDDLDQALGTAQTVTDAVIGTGKMLITAETPAVTLAGSSADYVVALIEVYRDAAAGGDTHGADARMIGAWVHYTVTAATDA